MDTLLGKILAGRYKILSALGGGAFGQTYVAEDLQLPDNPRCVVKQFKPQTQDPQTLETARRLFDTEATVLHRLGKHDQIPRLFAHFEEDGEFYLVQDCIEGQPLCQEIKKGNCLSETEVIAILQDILTVLAFVHQQNVIHRDIKPSNIIRRFYDKKLVLIDFGAVKQVTSQGVNDGFTVAIGTPGYMPSEQLAGQPRPNSDIYALGMMSIQALTGILPSQLPQNAQTGDPLWRPQVSINEFLANILDKMVRYHFIERYQSAGEVLLDLAKISSFFTEETQIKRDSLNDSLPLTLPPHTSTVSQNLTTPAAASTVSQETVVDSLIPPSKNKKFSYLLALMILTGFVVGGFFLFPRTDNLTAANQFLDAEKPEEALTVADKALAQNERDAQAWKIRGDALFLLERYESALSAYQKASELAPNNPKFWNNQGESFYILQRYQDALNAHRKALEIDPNNVVALNKIGLAFIGLQKYQDALDTFEKARQIKPNDPEAWENRGLALEYLQRRQDAQRAYEEALASSNDTLKLDPNNLQSRINSGRILNKLQRPEEALKVFDEAIGIKADFFPAWINKGNTLMLLRRPNEALKAFDKALEIRPKSYLTWHNRGSLLIANGRFDEAIKSYDKALQIQDQFYPAFREKGFALLQTKRSVEALSAFNQAVKIEPKDSKSWVGRSLALAELKRNDEALAGLDKAVEIEPKDPAAWLNRGLVQEQTQRYEEALKSYNKAVELDPTFQPAILARKKLQQKLN
ncbi:tetratricopeptide repeat protein [Ancylothrix sp. C2]|uniref:serine/threonine-protein kinase n=1 Tax=Ancylothrix sp. D3o TaxID=2953691 RepID=UPI0021BA7320|nr:serine/threonine-protein kinase [Ancylothrix sp. D3o]MCT7951708.1 tetratricopeptide repeat protein [Ancylothrix sp. D3o]